MFEAHSHHAYVHPASPSVGFPHSQHPHHQYYHHHHHQHQHHNHHAAAAAAAHHHNQLASPIALLPPSPLSSPSLSSSLSSLLSPALSSSSSSSSLASSLSPPQQQQQQQQVPLQTRRLFFADRQNSYGECSNGSSSSSSGGSPPSGGGGVHGIVHGSSSTSGRGGNYYHTSSSSTTTAAASIASPLKINTNATIPPRCPAQSGGGGGGGGRSNKPAHLVVTTSNLPPAHPPPNRPLPPRPVPVPGAATATSSASTTSHRDSSLQQQQRQRLAVKNRAAAAATSASASASAAAAAAYPSPDNCLPVAQPASMAARYLSRHPIHAGFASRYTIGQELGSGGFGFVCSALCHETNREVAVKFILKSKVPAQGWARDSELGVVPMEVFMLKNISHENVIKFVDFFEDMTFFYLVTELHGAPWTSSRTELHTQSLPAALETLQQTLLPSPVTPSTFGSSSKNNHSEFQQQPQQHQVPPPRATPGGLVCSSPITPATPRSPTAPPTPLSATPFFCSQQQQQQQQQRQQQQQQHPHEHQHHHQPPPRLTRRPSMDLFECIEQHDRLTEPQARCVFGQIVSAVAHLHSLGVVHRDIKDENILVDEDFHVKLVDFGSAAFIPQPPAGKLFDRFLGTIQYASPEILRGEKYRGPEAEVWALGCCLYIMLNGGVPFTTPQQAATQAYTFPKQGLSRECLDLLDAMLHKKASRRPTVSEVVNHPWLNEK
ncbi:hypothetical protein HDU86_000049 [Geranomyces michiganensis]|nr:hypothetical protein HDU86_000049 [Geranomyces michiganensis]